MAENTEEQTIILSAVGDICPGDVSIMGMGVLSKSKKYSADYPIQKARAFFAGADIVLGNLEGLLTSKVKLNGSNNLKFCGLPEFADALAQTGFTVLDLANNHTLEHGPEIFLETVDILKKTGIQICGLRSKSTSYYSEPVILLVKGRRIGLLGYNWVGKDNFPDADQYIAQSHDSVVNYTWNRDCHIDKKHQAVAHVRNTNVIKDIKTLKKEVDHVVLMAHWGYEFVHYPPYGVTLEARSFIDAGADLIIGNHPHVLQGMEQFNGKWIFYSLGNFIFDIRSEVTRKTAILDYRINENYEDTFDLLYMKISKNFQPVSVSGAEKKRIAAIIKNSIRVIQAKNKALLLDDDSVYKQFEKQYNRGKFYNILNHILALPRNPFVSRIIAIKVLNFLKLLILRVRGKKIRW